MLAMKQLLVFVVSLSVLLGLVRTQRVNSVANKNEKKSSNFWYGGGIVGNGFGGAWQGAGFGFSPQQNHDGLWSFVAVPIPLENQTLPEGDFPQEQVAQAKLWGPIYRSGHGWVYGEAGTILVPRIPPYVPPTIIPPPRSVPGAPSSVSAVNVVPLTKNLEEPKPGSDP